MIQDAPLAYYKMDDNVAGAFTDFSGNGNNTNSGSTNTKTNTASLILTSSDASANYGAAGILMNLIRLNLGFTQTKTSVEAWVNTFAGAANNIISYGNNGAAGTSQKHQLRLGTGTPQFLCFNAAGAAQQVNATVTVNDGRTHHLVGTYDGANMNIYIDGALNNTNATGAFTSPVFGVDTTLGISVHGVSGSNYSGFLDEVSFYDYDLTAAQVLNHYTKATSLS